MIHVYSGTKQQHQQQKYSVTFSFKINLLQACCNFYSVIEVLIRLGKAEMFFCLFVLFCFVLFCFFFFLQWTMKNKQTNNHAPVSQGEVGYKKRGKNE